MNKEKIVHWFIVAFCCCLIVGLISVPLELIYVLFNWQPLAGRILIYGILIVTSFYKYYDNITVETIDKNEENDDDK